MNVRSESVRTDVRRTKSEHVNCCIVELCIVFGKLVEALIERIMKDRKFWIIGLCFPASNQSLEDGDDLVQRWDLVR